MLDTAKRAAIVTLVVVGIVVATLALWKLRLVVGLLFSASAGAPAHPGRSGSADSSSGWCSRL